MAESKKVKVKQNALINYFQASYEELRKVTWPTRNQAIRMTFLVLGFCVVTAAMLGVLDYVFSTGHKALLNLSPAEVYEETTTPLVNPINDATAMPEVAGEPVTVTTGEEEVVTEPAEAADTTEETTTP